MLTAARADSTSQSRLTGYRARGLIEGGAAGVYGSWSNDVVYLDASMQHGRFRHRVTGDGLDAEQYSARLWQSSLEAGYRIGIGQLGAMAVHLQPELQLVHAVAGSVEHREVNGTVVRSLGTDGLSTRLGVQLQGDPRDDSGARISPYLAANWYRDDTRAGIAFDDALLEAGTPANRYGLDAGARFAWRPGLAAWGGISHVRGDGGFRESSARLGVGWRW
jgi:autotransporter family porin